jgi:DNA helicase-2/ATP-dependent DNA helicase PcrA
VEIIRYTQENLNSKTLYFDDASVLSYLKLRLYGSDVLELNSACTPTGGIEYKNIRQVVIDEAQDYYPLHYEIFKLLFPSAKYTILGDINQTLEKEEELSFYDRISSILDKKKSTLAVMDKSFRCTNEILKFSSKFLSQKTDIQSFNREGKEPVIHMTEDQATLYNKIVSVAESCLAEGYRSIGLICKTGKNAVSLYENLKDRIKTQLVMNESAVDLEGVMIIPVYMSKGLEFDAVLICDADNQNYHNEEDRKLLYIACTRALHRLELFCCGVTTRLDIQHCFKAAQ